MVLLVLVSSVLVTIALIVLRVLRIGRVELLRLNNPHLQDLQHIVLRRVFLLEVVASLPRVHVAQEVLLVCVYIS